MGRTDFKGHDKKVRDGWREPNRVGGGVSSELVEPVGPERATIPQAGGNTGPNLHEQGTLIALRPEFRITADNLAGPIALRYLATMMVCLRMGTAQQIDRIKTVAAEMEQWQKLYLKV